MKEKHSECFLLWSETSEFKTKVLETKRLIDEVLKRYSKPYLAYSGGKDSITMIHLVLSKNRNIALVHWDYGRYYIPREIEREILSIAEYCGATNIQILTSSLYNELKRTAKGVIGKYFIGIEVPKLIKKGYNACFLGLRAEESNKRRKRLKWFYEYDKRGITNIFPLKNWAWKDVWAYIVSNNLPYPSIYDRYAEVLGYDKVRLVTFFDMEFERLGSVYVDGVLMPEFRNI